MGSRLEKNSNTVRKRIENHTFNDEQGEEYEGSKFGGFSDYMRRKKIKLQNLDAELRSQSSGKPQIFRGIVAQVNGYTQPSLSDLHQLIVSHGGGFLQYLDGKTACTHIIASQLTPKKKAEFARYRIVKPAWIVDSVNAGRLLPWDNYRLVDEGVTQKVLGFDNGQVVSQVNRPTQSYRAQTDTSWYTSHLQASGTEQGAASLINGEKQETEIDGYRKAGSSLLLPDDFMDDDDDEEFLAEAVEADSEKERHTELDLATGQPDVTIQPDITLPNTIGLDEDSPLFQQTSGRLVSADSKQREKKKLTAEEHNAILLSNPHMAKSSTANPDFINQYYRESRLHHLSAWKADLKAQLQARAAEKSSSQKDRAQRKPGARRYIMHVDFDSFFAAVSLRKNLHLIDQPVVVAHGSGPGSEIASCNYPARKYGVKNGMWMKYALELCPKLKVLPYDFKAYEEASRHFYDAILAIDAVVQSISIDEALIDVSLQCLQAGNPDGMNNAETSISQEQKKADCLAEALRIAIKGKTGCDVSVGIGGNILLAKVALRKAKPAGQHQILPQDILAFIGELEVTSLPGVAHSLGKKLEELGVKLVKDIRNLTKERLVSALGPKTGEKLWDYSRGVDKVEVGDQVVRKSVSAEVNWGIRFITQQQAEEFVQALCDELRKRLLENGVKGRQMTMKIMRKAADAGMDPPKNLGHGKCDTFNKSIVLGVATNDAKVLGKEAISILRSYGFSPGELRGLGVQMQRLEALKPTAANTSLSDGSQRRLTFMKPDTRANNEDVASHGVANEKSALLPSRSTDGAAHVEAIEEFESPHKIRPNPFVTGAVVNTNQSNEKPINMFGSQFVLPSQVDPTVLAELPEDIRSKLAPRRPATKQTAMQSPLLGPTTSSRSSSPYRSDPDYELPRQSQLDPEAFAALPEDVKEELLAHYRTADKQNATEHNQSLLPQSPRKAKPLLKKAVTTPVKKHKISSLLARGQSKSKHAAISTMTQSNFVSLPRGVEKGREEELDYSEDIPQSFLDELPDDIRSEIMAEQRRNRMKLKSGLNVGDSRRKPRIEKPKNALLPGQQTLQLPDRLEGPTFTSRKLTKLSDLHEVMSAWVQEFSGDGGHGPYAEDVSALGIFLSRVVKEEGDMAKAASVINWLVYLISDWPFTSESIRSSWYSASRTLKSAVQDAVKKRGLPPILFSES